VEGSKGTEEFFDLTFSEEPASYYHLLVTIDQHWLHAAWYHSTKNLITGYARYPFRGSLQSLLKEHPYLASEFKEVIVTIQAENYLVYPKHVLDGSNPNIFRLTNTFEEDSQSLLTEELVSLQASISFTAPTDLVNEIYTHFKHVRILSHVHPRIEQEYNTVRSSQRNRPIFSAHIWNDQIDLRAYKEGKIYLANSYFQSGKEDVAYYVLYACELLEIDPEEAKLVFSGDIEMGDPTWELLSKYWKEMEIVAPLENISISDKLREISHPRYDYLTHSLLCVS